jgi:hypothetical protein
MDDFGTPTQRVGHRRWMLFPPRASMATGDVPARTSAPRRSNALYVFGPQGRGLPRRMASRGRRRMGAVPEPAVDSNRWSLSYPGADFANATVTMTGPTGPFRVDVEPIATGYGDNTIVFRPPGSTTRSRRRTRRISSP